MRSLLTTLFICSLTVVAAAQSPNTATIVLDVIDQSGAVINAASVSAVNTATGAVRDAISGNDGSAAIPALSLTGKYRVVVSKLGFGTEEVNDITLRSGETVTLKVKLLVGSSEAQVTVYGTVEGVRADAQIGRQFDSAQIDKTPILGRKLS